LGLGINIFRLWVWVKNFMDFGFGYIYPTPNPDFFGLNALWPIFAKNRKKMKICKYDQI
jgi:hypothetical protein